MLADLLSPLLGLLPRGAGAVLSGPAGAVAASALVALLLVLPRATRPAALGAGLLVAVLWVLPPVWPSPRQVPERLPALAAGLLVLPLLLAALRLPGWAVRGAALVAAAWWMAGAPLWLPDVRAAALPLALLAAAGLWCAVRPPGLPEAAGVAAALSAGLALAGWAGGLMAWLALAVTAAALPAAGRRAGGPAAEAAASGLLIALAAVPLLVRGEAADWLAAAAGAAALLAGGVGARAVRVLFAPQAARLFGPLMAALPVLAVAAWRAGWPS